MKSPTHKRKKIDIEDLYLNGVYENLRHAHFCIKDIWHIPQGYDNLSDKMKQAIEHVHSALYLAEHIACNEMYPPPHPKRV